MNKQEDFYKDELIKDLMKNVEMEETPEHFTNKVMDEVMQDWLARPIAVKKPISRKQWIWIAGLILILLVIVLGTDVRTLISGYEHPFFKQLDAVFLQPINQILTRVFVSLTKVPFIVYILVIAMASLATFDRIIHKFIQYR